MYDTPGLIGANYHGEVSPPNNDDVIRPGDHVRALSGRDELAGHGLTGIVEELKWGGRAVVFWTSKDRTTVRLNTLSKIQQGGGR